MKQAKDRIQGAKGICKKGGLLLHKFVCNKRSKRAIDVVLDRPSKELSIEKVRVQWFNGCFSATLKDHPLTKGGAISTVASAGQNSAQVEVVETTHFASQRVTQ